MIDEKKLIEQLDYYVSHTTEDSGEHYAYIQCKELIEKQPKISLENKTSDWIPVEEALPTNTENVLITTMYGVVLMAFYGNSKRWLKLNGKELEPQDYPIAWQPLPQKYEG